MKKIIVAFSLLFFWNVKSQEIQNQIYDEAIIQIKKSELFNKYSIGNKSLNNNFKVSGRTHSICELYSLFRKEISSKNVDYCQNKDWMNDKVLNSCSLQKKSDKGKKSFHLRFTSTLENYFIAEIKFKSDTNNSLIYLFEIKGNKATIISTGNVFYD